MAGRLLDRTSGSSASPVLRPYEQVVQRIAEAIQRGELKPGMRLRSERDLASMYGVGRATVREAVAALSNSGALTTRRGSGSYVALEAPEIVTRERHRDASPNELLLARAPLEPLIAKLAAENGRPSTRAEQFLDDMDRAVDFDDPMQRSHWSEADRHFHLEIARMTDNVFLVEAAQHICDVMAEPLWNTLRDSALTEAHSAKIFRAEHRIIYDAVVQSEPKLAEVMARRHLKSVGRFMRLADED